MGWTFDTDDAPDATLLFWRNSEGVKVREYVDWGPCTDANDAIELANHWMKDDGAMWWSVCGKASFIVAECMYERGDGEEIFANCDPSFARALTIAVLRAAGEVE